MTLKRALFERLSRALTHARPALALSAGAAIALAPSACAVGPNYHPPAPPPQQGYTREALPARTVSTGVAGPGGQAQSFELGRDLTGQWWMLFGSPKLDALIRQAMASYPDIAAQQAALRAARENVRAEEGSFLPQVQGAGIATRSQTPGELIFPGFPNFIENVFEATVSVSYTFDFFGKQRRTVEGLQAQAVQQGFVLEASYLTLTSNVVTQAIQVASVRDQVAATHDIIAIEEHQLSIVQRRYELGSQTRADILQQESNLAAVRATLPGLQQQLAQAHHQLALLTGRSPRDATPVELGLADLALPQNLPVSLPSSLVAQRPDIRQQAAVVHQMSANIGVATANMLPQVTLYDTSFGNASTKASTLAEASSGIWSFGGQIAAPLFEGGALRAKRRASVDAYDQAVAQYRLVVLQAFQAVADALTALQNDAQGLKAQRDALDAAQASLALTQRQYEVGAVDSVTLLAAQQSYQQARLSYVRALASRYTDTVTLFAALGGGWWNRNDPGRLPGIR
ncbi:MAG TPA: efflux transporter outer membrane subunit [Steroidobacteraceae bacterium]|nr:efflux transporter outer membrane subunit [Steroidobacteraceae bacterium]